MEASEGSRRMEQFRRDMKSPGQCSAHEKVLKSSLDWRLPKSEQLAVYASAEVLN